MERFAPNGASGRGDAAQDPADFGRYRRALARSWLLILAVVAPLTALVVLVSLQLPPTYRASATIALREEGVSRAGGNPELVRRELETIERLVTTRTVLSAAARRLPDESADTLAEKVSASASAEANLVRVSAEDGTAAGAAQIANVVSGAFLSARVASERRALAASRTALRQRIDRLGDSGGGGDERAALRAGLRELVATEAGLGAELALADPARAPESPDSPRLLQNTVFALFGFTFIAVLVALAKDQILPRIRDARELAALVGAPLLIEMPTLRGFARHGRSEHEAYEALLEAVLPELSEEEVQTVLVASPRRERSAAEVARGLCEAFARRGEIAALVGAVGPGNGVRPPLVSELLRGDDARSQGTKALFERAELRPGLFAFLQDEDAGLGSRSQLGALVDRLRRHDVRFIVLVGQPLLVSPGALLLPRMVDGLVLVCRPEHTTRDDAVRLRELLRAGDASVLGIVSIGARQIIPYVAHGSETVLEPSL